MYYDIENDVKIVNRELQMLSVIFLSWGDPAQESPQWKSIVRMMWTWTLVLRNEEKIEWLAGSLQDCLFYRLHADAFREVPLIPEKNLKDQGVFGL